MGDLLYVRAFDGTAWSAWNGFNVNPPANHAAVVTADATRTLAKGVTSVAASSLFSVSDADGDAITQYQLWDGTTDAASGHWVVDGIAQGTKNNITVSAAQLANATYQTGTVGDLLYVRAFDGTAWSAWNGFNVNPA